MKSLFIGVIAIFLTFSLSSSAQDFHCQSFLKRNGSLYLNAKEACGIVDDYAGNYCVVLSGVQVIAANELVREFIAQAPEQGMICVKGQLEPDGTARPRFYADEIKYP